MRIPAADHALIPREKIVKYLLNLDHPDGGSKAALLTHVGFSADRPEELERALRTQHLSLAAKKGKPSAYGEKYEIVGPLTGAFGEIMVRSIWITLRDKSVPRLITLIPEKKV